MEACIGGMTKTMRTMLMKYRGLFLLARRVPCSEANMQSNKALPLVTLWLAAHDLMCRCRRCFCSNGGIELVNDPQRLGDHVVLFVFGERVDVDAE